MDKYSNKYNHFILYICVSLLFGITFINEIPHGDDVNNFALSTGSIFECFKKAIEYFSISGSNVISFTFNFFANSNPIIVFIFLISISMYITLSSLRYIIFIENKNICFDLLICSSLLLYRFEDMESAGWITTSMAYFIPASLMVVSLIPAFCIVRNKDINRLNFISFILAMLYATDSPQALISLLIVYFVTLVYSIVRKKSSKNIYIIFFILILKLLFTILCPGNSVRTTIEISSNIPTYYMNNFINKIDVGLFSTFSWLYFSNNYLYYFIVTVFAALLQLRKKDSRLLLVSIIPIVLPLIFSKMARTNLYISGFGLTQNEIGTSGLGLFCLENIYNIETYLLFAVIMTITCIIIYEIILLSNNCDELLVTMSLLISGFCSRAAMAFTPNIFVSNTRTCIFFAFYLVLLSLYVINNNSHLIRKKYYMVINIFSILIVVIRLLVIFVYITNYGR